MATLKLKGNENILVVRPDRIGDLVLTLPVASVIKSIYPGVNIEFLVSAYNYPLIKYAGYIDGFMLRDQNRQCRKPTGSLIAELESRNYEIAMFAKPDLFTAFCIYMAGIPLRVGTLRRGYSFLFNVRPNLPRRHSSMHELDLNLSLLEPFGISAPAGPVRPILNLPERTASDVEELAGIDSYVVIHPGSGGSAPNWPSDYYAELIQRLSRKIKIVVSGQGKDTFSGLANVVSLVNKTDFEKLVNVINRARLFISGSTGPLHVAAALGIPVIGFYPDHKVLGVHRWGPRGKSVTVIAPEKQNGHICRIKDNGSCVCLESIDVDSVYEKVLGMIAA